ncbi:sirohydrochlorin cobaltochelatase [Acidovorax delafieldii]|jgi:sirohydrochlorin cobaltochelatase|uniref:Sirohydrochlorin cobaltochelatase n=1 Tax=Acidovorax delafieldii TaxID=47920 RepID=A0A561XQG2_ACIDE|nr:CbiX/SirB N-terminal domain-containing protein [Acidovorax delafieldii]TWG38354.1 sirohydrochlorin cobaltochelatase [Acidovorax delafieldii]|eukprot:gene10014-10082_t
MTHAIVLFAHGSRDPLWRAPMEAVATRIASQSPDRRVICAYLELCEPALPDAVRQLVADGATAVTVVPMFLGTGKHAREDLPLLVQELRTAHPAVQFHVQAAIGEDPRMTALMAEIACESPPL